MATALVDLEWLAVRSPQTFLVRRNGQDSALAGRSRLQRRWNLSNAAKGLTIGVQRLEQHGGSRRRVLIRAKKERSSDGGAAGNRGRGDLKLEATDMMELEFGRLLGEDRQTTLAKVVGKKLNPDLTYVKIEKEKELQYQRQAARRSNPPKISAPAKPDFKQNEKANGYTTPSFEQGVPDLVAPPVRPPGFEKLDASPVRTIRVAPLVRPSGLRKSVDADSYELDGLVRKPMRVSDSEVGMPPARPEKEVIAPMLMRRKEDASLESQTSKLEDNLLRRPSAIRSNALGEPLTQDQVTPSTSTEDVQSGDEVDTYEMSEERFRQLLEEMPSRGQGTISRSSPVSKKVSPLVKPVLPSLERKPSILEKAQPVDARNDLIGEPANSTNSARSESVPSPQISEHSNSPPKVSTRPKAKLFQPPLVRPQSIPEVAVVTEVPSDVNDENKIIEDVQTEYVISLEESKTDNEVEEASLDTMSAKDLEDIREEVLSSLPVVKPDGEDTLTDNMDVQASTTKDSTSEAPAKRLVIKLRKTNLPLQQPVLSVDEGSLEGSTSQGTSTAQDKNVEDQAKPASDSASERQLEEAVSVGEQGIKEELQGTIPKAALRLSKPASPAAFISKKPAVVDITLNTLQKAISSFDEKRVLPNKKEEDEDWARAEALRDSKSIEELQIIGTGRGGLLVGFGSLVGYLPAFELTAKRRPPSFTVWAQNRGYDAQAKEYFQDKEDLARDGTTTTSEERTNASVTRETGGLVNALELRNSKAIYPELLEQFKKERAEALSLVVGQKTKVIVISVDRTLRQLRLSEKQAEGEGQELSQRKVTLMESLNVGDIVTCTVKKITTFGAFVDLQGVPALIHSSELSWNRNTDPLSVLQVGQEVKTKVCKLDRFLQRINLSLKLMQPDPLLETLESLVSPDSDIVGGSADVEIGSDVEENAELNRFTSKLEQIPEIIAVRSGRRVRGAALAPAFQIYLSGPLENGYKLLARFGNEVQEVLVETNADRERMKDFIRDCTVQDS